MSQLNILLFGIGKIGSAFVNTYLEKQLEIEQYKGIRLNLAAISNTGYVFWRNPNDQKHQWFADLENAYGAQQTEALILAFKDRFRENLVAIDATSSDRLVKHYPFLIENQFHIVSSNKQSNTQDLSFHIGLRNLIREHRVKYFYETQVGSGLPVLETLRRIFQSGDTISKVRGVFSGSISYLFNSFSDENRAFSKILDETEQLGLTETDFRKDLTGTDAAQKLLIIARELKIDKELKDIETQNLIPPSLRQLTTVNQLRKKSRVWDAHYHSVKQKLNKDEVLRYVAELDTRQKLLKVELLRVPREHPYGSLTGTENIFEIYSESYNPEPLIIKGSGGGPRVTANSLLREVLKVAEFLPTLV